MKMRSAGVFVATLLLFSSMHPPVDASQLADALVVELQCTATWPSPGGEGVYCFGVAHGAISGIDNTNSRYVGACAPSCPVEAWVTHQEDCGALMGLPAIAMLWGDMVIRSIVTSFEELADLSVPFAALSVGLYSPTIVVIAGTGSGRGQARLDFRSGYYSNDAARGEGLGIVLPVQPPQTCASPGPAGVALTFSLAGV